MNLLATLDGIISKRSLFPFNLFAIEIIEHCLNDVRMYYEQTDDKSANEFCCLKQVHLLDALVHCPESVACNSDQEGHKCKDQKLHEECTEIVLVKINYFFGRGQEAIYRDNLGTCF
jgi:hypothetical protein